MKLSISNIGWQAENDASVYDLMRQNGFCGLEIAPTRIFPEAPYDRLAEAKKWADDLLKTEGFVIPSMQSIWFGRQEKLFGTNEERNTLLEYTKKAIDFAESVGCGNLVFGCPRNRNISEGTDCQESNHQDLNSRIAVPFFRELGEYAFSHGTVIGMEANPPIYNTNYINDTVAALELVSEVDSRGFRLNFDLGTVIVNGEDLLQLARKVHLINHVHISEPGLNLIEKRELHRELKEILEAESYEGFVSVEMGKREDVSEVAEALQYVKSVFG